MDTQIMDMTKELANDFVCFKLGKGKAVNSISLTAKTLRRIAADAEANHGDLFANMIRTIACDSVDISQSFLKVVEAMFADNIINWGRVAILFTFSGHLALYCDRHGSHEEADSVVHWLTQFVKRRLLKWIENNGGWESFNEHFKERKDANSMCWSDVLCTVGLVAGAAGAALVFAR